MLPPNAQELDRLLLAMLDSAAGISDLLFVPGQPPQVETYGVLQSLPLSPLASAQVEMFARLIINENPKLLTDLAAQGSCDCSYGLPAAGRFRVNIYRQNGNFAMVMRRIPLQIPTLQTLGLPTVFREVIQEKNGLVFVTGGAGNGKTTTLTALLNEINQESRIHIVTLEDPIEFLHPHQQSTFSQRELGRDFFNFPDGFRAALRQAPKVIFVGEIRDRETLEIALTAGETGHLVLSTLHTTSADQTIHRILGMFRKDEEPLVRERLASSLRYVIGQRLVPQKSGGRLLITEFMGSSLRTREAIEQGENDSRRLHDIIDAGGASGWHSFEQSLLKAFETNLISEETALSYSVNKPKMRQRLDLARNFSQRPGKSGPGTGQMIVVADATPGKPSSAT